MRSRSETLSIGVFAAAVVVGFIALVTSLGRYYWFNGDEWQFLANRTAGDAFEAHNEHLVALPALVYRLQFTLWGLDSYLPYQIPVIVLHLTAVVLVWLIMRRAGVHPWLATAAASVFILFGPGEENIIWAFQITLTGSLVCGLAHLLLADHDGPWAWRDTAGLGLGFLGLLCSGLSPLLTVVVGAVVWIRRGLPMAARHTVPLGVAYLVWWAVEGPDIIEDPYGRSADVGEILAFAGHAIAGTFEGLGGNAVVAIGYGVVLIGGLVVAYAPLPRRQALEQAAVPVGLLLAGLAFVLVSAYGRWWVGPNTGDSSRYLHLAAALTLPALAVAIDALVRRWPPAVALASVALVAVIPHNIGDFENHPTFTEPYFDARQRIVVSLANAELADEVSPQTRPDPLNTPVPVGFLTDLRDDGRLPDVDPEPLPAERLLFGLAQVPGDNPYTDCEVTVDTVDISMDAGDELGFAVGPWSEPRDGWFFHQSVTVQLLEDGEPVGPKYLRHPSSGGRLVAQVDDLHFRMELFGRTEAIVLCDPV